MSLRLVVLVIVVVVALNSTLALTILRVLLDQSHHVGKRCIPGQYQLSVFLYITLGLVIMSHMK